MIVDSKDYMIPNFHDFSKRHIAQIYRADFDYVDHETIYVDNDVLGDPPYDFHELSRIREGRSTYMKARYGKLKKRGDIK
jgi:hypothetical protein